MRSNDIISDKNRLDSFMDKIRTIDQQFKPDDGLLESDPTEHLKKFRLWKKKLKQTWENESRWLTTTDLDPVTVYNRATDYRSRCLKELETLASFKKCMLSLIPSNPDYKELLESLASGSCYDVKFKTNHLKRVPSDAEKNLRETILDTPYLHPVINYIKLPSVLRQEALKKIKEPSDKDITRLPIKKLLFIAKTVLENCEQHKYFDILAALTLVTGRATPDLAVFCSFEPSSKSKEAIFKTADTAFHFRDDMQIKIPLLCSYDLMIKAFKHMRSLRDYSGLSKREINRRVSTPIIRSTKKLFEHDRVNPTHLRSVYLKHTYRDNKTDISFDEYYSILQGRKPNNDSSIPSQSHVHIIKSQLPLNKHRKKHLEEIKSKKIQDAKNKELIETAIRRLNSLDPLEHSGRKDGRDAIRKIKPIIMDILKEGEIPTRGVVRYRTGKKIRDGIIWRILNFILKED